MSGSGGWLVAAPLLVLVLGGVYAIGSPSPVDSPGSIGGSDSLGGPDAGGNGLNASVRTCELLPDYDYDRMLSRVERIKGTQLSRNVSICVERTTGGIDTTSNRRRFGYVGEPGLAFFDLPPVANARQRSSLGHMEVSPHGGRIEIFLANESVVADVPWLSYEALVAHELSHAVEIPAATVGDSATTGRVATTPTTDSLLAGQAVSNGVSLHVADVYVERYGGHLNVSALDVGHRNWKRRMAQSVYYAGYRYSERTDRRTVPTGRPKATAGVLHPGDATNVTGLPPRPNLSVDGLTHVRTDRVGELFLREVLISNGLSPERAAVAADGWTNDRMDYFRVNGSSVVTWRVSWQNAGEVAEFVETYDAVYDFERVEAVKSIDCREPGRYLATAGDSVTVVQCSG